MEASTTKSRGLVLNKKPCLVPLRDAFLILAQIIHEAYATR